MPSLPSTSRHQEIMQLLATAIIRLHKCSEVVCSSQKYDDGVKNALDFQGELSVTLIHNHSVK